MPKDNAYTFSMSELYDDLAFIMGDAMADLAEDREAEIRDDMFTRQAEEAADHKKDRS